MKALLRRSIRHTLLILFCFVTSATVLAQVDDLRPITLISGKKQKHIHPGQWMEISQGDAESLARDACRCPSWRGRFLGVTEDSLLLQTHTLVLSGKTPDDLRYRNHEYYIGDQQSFPVMAFALRDITVIGDRGKGKSMRTQSAGQTIGLILVGLGTGALSATIYAENRGTVALVGLAEMMAGFVLIASSNSDPKTYFLIEATHRGKPRRIWTIR